MLCLEILMQVIVHELHDQHGQDVVRQHAGAEHLDDVWVVDANNLFANLHKVSHYYDLREFLQGLLIDFVAEDLASSDGEVNFDLMG